ncbi:hypothetical protein H2248_001761 [Termitomyces sp. 'cryptogamus']|nr:hypothetical protein H2248_001761 [Termitomyces sp. 'cryptogamus']
MDNAQSSKDMGQKLPCLVLRVLVADPANYRIEPMFGSLWRSLFRSALTRMWHIISFFGVSFINLYRTSVIMNPLPTNPALSILEFAKSQSLMDELFGDDINEPLEIVPSSSEPLTGCNSIIETCGIQDPYAALTAQWQQAFALPASTSTAQWQQTLALPASASCDPPPTLPHYAPGFASPIQFYGVQTPNIPLYGMMNLALAPQAVTTYQDPSYSYQAGHPNHFFDPTQQSSMYHCQTPYQTEIPSSIPTSMAFPSPHDLYSSGCEQNSFDLSLAPPPAFVSMAPANCIQDPATHTDNYITHFTSPTPSNGTTDYNNSQSSSTSSTREHIRRPRYVPRISRTELSLARGVFCDIVFQCEWGSCGTVYQLEGNTYAEETAFQNRVLKHLSEHASLSSKAPEDRKLQCQWGDCHRRMSPTTKERGMIRHLQSHIAAWYYFCPNLECSHTSSRRVLKSHSNLCAFNGTSVEGKLAKQSWKTKTCL